MLNGEDRKRYLITMPELIKGYITLHDKKDQTNVWGDINSSIILLAGERHSQP